ncbi:hypothetical protein SERLADRAFT_432089 [Serpula lacrymans var. lacrymans S7.9]|uniref:Uncharacterized protein n=1 Tax=Serpula lacrymans var. lacrymans (strain S7.9) TaxID=578457 RepID=F8NDZ2_SERL9|nr:uncharacterized protein SERLADRAFT_432089 [Serpula lacrymans var. lacrymans S7.9]EGO30520.1 hypothetical protein SERLADRAFT_432089 [Serpula lacrymans var. lacrymans S7.9]
MSPATLLENSALATTFSVPKLAKDGSNWVTYKSQVAVAVGARGLSRHLSGTAESPTILEYTRDSNGVATKAEGTTLKEEDIEEYQQKLNEFNLPWKNSSAAKIWKAISNMHDGQTEMMQIDV